MTDVEKVYDLIVIGGGAVGENVADRGAQGGLKTAIVESGLVGGACSYWACMPSKALLRPGAVRDAAAGVPGVSTPDLDPSAIFAWRDDVASHWKDDGQAAWVESAGIDLVRGHARFTGPRVLEVTDASGGVTTLRASAAIVVSTGSAALIPDIPGLAEAKPWIADDATSASAAPASLAIIGGGVVAVEMATAYASFGTTVTMLVRSGLLSAMEPIAADAQREALEANGVTILDGVSAEAVAATADGYRLTLPAGTGGEGGDTLDVEKLLVATGRTPVTGDLGLELVGLEAGTWLPTDDTLRVLDGDGEPIDWLYATGDVNHRALLTHQGKYQARAAGDRIAAAALGKPIDDSPWGTHVATADHAAVPQVVFGNPEIAAIGLTAAQAEKAGIRTRVIDYDLGAIAGSTVHTPGYAGAARMVVDEDRSVVVGVTFVGQDVSEMLQAATFAVVGEIPLARLWHAVPAYPTMSEIWLRLLETYGRPA